MFFLNSPISPGKLVMMPESALTAVAEDKGMTSPLMWTSSSAMQMSSPSIYSDSSLSSSIASKQGVEALVDC
jgi:serine/threonine-protein kinase ULK1